MAQSIPLTETELEVLKLLADGLTTKGIAFQMDISDIEVRQHRNGIRRKLGTNNIAMLTKYAVIKGLVPINPKELSAC